jgi:hypothetical protein
MLIELLLRKSGMTGLFKLMLVMIIIIMIMIKVYISGVHSNIGHVQTDRK